MFVSAEAHIKFPLAVTNQGACKLCCRITTSICSTLLAFCTRPFSLSRTWYFRCTFHHVFEQVVQGQVVLQKNMVTHTTELSENLHVLNFPEVPQLLGEGRPTLDQMYSRQYSVGVHILPH